MRYELILNAVYNQPLAILPEKLDEIRSFLALRVAGQEVPPEQVAQVVAGRRPINVQMAGRVAVVPVFGVISQRVGLLEQASGGVSTEALGATLDSLVADRDVKAIVLAFDSPGGSVFGVQELADKIRSLGQEKKIVGLADSVAASAAYWLLSQTSEVNVTPGGQVGSIGVIAAHQDVSKWEELQGVKTTYITAGKYKAEGAPEMPLSEEARGELQSKVDHYYGQFVAAVARGRSVSETKVKGEFGEGRMVTAKEAVAKGMADRVATLEQVLRRLGGTAGGDGPGANGSQPVLAARLAGYRARAAELEE